jgi:hypothetical protein
MWQCVMAFANDGHIIGRLFMNKLYALPSAVHHIVTSLIKKLPFVYHLLLIMTSYNKCETVDKCKSVPVVEVIMS